MSIYTKRRIEDQDRMQNKRFPKQSLSGKIGRETGSERILGE
jgi:hypothetical protein